MMKIMVLERISGNFWIMVACAVYLELFPHNIYRQGDFQYTGMMIIVKLLYVAGH
jgi:hypothetical protein